MTTTDWVQATAMIVLVVVTSVYAWQTKRMVREMRFQRLTARPVVIPDIGVLHGPGSYTDNMQDLAQSHFPVALTNVGTAAAIELELSLKIPTKNLVSEKLPLLLPGATWTTQLTYVADFTKEGEPIFDQPRPEGLHELRVTLRPAPTHPEAEFSEVTLPFDLLWTGRSFYWKIKKHELRQRLAEAINND
jgi:hypothetical protein